MDAQQRGGGGSYFNDYGQDDDVDIDYPNYGQEYDDPYSYGRKPSGGY